MTAQLKLTLENDLAIAHDPCALALLDQAVGDPASADLCRLLALEVYVEQLQHSRFARDALLDDRRQQLDDPRRHVVHELVDDRGREDRDVLRVRLCLDRPRDLYGEGYRRSQEMGVGNA